MCTRKYFIVAAATAAAAAAEGVIDESIDPIGDKGTRILFHLSQKIVPAGRSPSNAPRLYSAAVSAGR